MPRPHVYDPRPDNLGMSEADANRSDDDKRGKQNAALLLHLSVNKVHATLQSTLERNGKETESDRMVTAPKHEKADIIWDV